jgi:carbonic anhydrase
VGHTRCGGAAACHNAAQAIIKGELAGGAPIATVPHLPATAPINRWLAPLTRLAASLPPSPAPIVQLVEENVRTQVANIASTETGRKVPVYGWVYEIENGTLRDLCVSQGPSVGESHV